MPLPTALAAKLAKRGLISEQEKIENEAALAEEVFAEDYDDQKGQISKAAQEDIRRRLKGHSGCPNKYNIYHECSDFCIEKYGDGHLNPDTGYLNRKNAMLLQYPLTEDWKEEYDPGTASFYFWNLATDTVSWYPPGHPKHAPSEPACVLREDVKLAEMEKEDEEDSESEEDEKSDEEMPPPVERRAPRAVNYSKGRSKKKENDLDPMDPASYSDIPRGNWSAGLMVRIDMG